MNLSFIFVLYKLLRNHLKLLQKSFLNPLMDAIGNKRTSKYYKKNSQRKQYWCPKKEEKNHEFFFKLR